MTHTVTHTNVHRFGYIPDLPDHRDHPLLMTHRPPSALTLPVAVHLERTSAFQFPVYDQGDLGSCVANATAAAFQATYRRMHARNIRPSRLAIYYGARRVEHSIESDSGCMIRDAIKTVAKEGAGAEIIWPYDVTKFRSAPSMGYYANATQHQALVYERVPQERDAIRGVIAAHYPIIFGISVYDSIDTEVVNATGHVPDPKTSDHLEGGHGILMCGYEDSGVIFRNSWGASWGNKGYGFLSWDYVLNADLAEDFWVIKSVEI